MSLEPLVLLARPEGFEPTTLGLEMWWLILSPLFHAISHTLLSIITVTNIDDYYYLKCILYRIPCLVLWLCCDSIIQGLFFSMFNLSLTLWHAFCHIWIRKSPRCCSALVCHRWPTVINSDAFGVLVWVPVERQIGRRVDTPQPLFGRGVIQIVLYARFYKVNHRFFEMVIFVV